MKVGENALAEFLDMLIVWEAEIVAILLTNRAINRLSARQQKEYDNTTRCYICRHEFVEGKAKGPKVWDHDHITGWFIGAAHRKCNLERPVSFKIPVFFQNFRGYDAHLIVHEFGKRPDREIKVIGQNMKKYLQVEWGQNMVFRDTLQFLPASLKNLAASLAKVGRGYFQNLNDVVTDVYPDAYVELLERKGVFCYDYVDSFLGHEEPALPPREAFFNKLLSVECTQADYTHAHYVWDNFNCSSLKEYMALYLLSAICLLADVFQAFRNNSLDKSQLDPVYFVSEPQLVWNTLVKHIDRPIPQITDPEMYRMIQPNIRGGICNASVRYARAYNKFMGSLYDPRLPTSYIMEVDANNLYGWAMSQEMRDGDFEWVSDDECRNLEQLINYADGRIAIFNTGLFDHWKNEEYKKSFIFEVDLEYPPQLHERDDDYPLAPEVMTIEPEITGDKQHNLRAQYFGAACPYSRKLISSFFPKKH